jgi:superfamily II DNA/RNA helicase
MPSIVNRPLVSQSFEIFCFRPQVGRVAKLLAHFAKFRSVCLSVEDSKKNLQKTQLRGKLVDLIVCTPARLEYHVVCSHAYRTTI